MSKRVLDISQMQHLKELGVDTSKASMCHAKFDGENDFSNLLPNNQELFERLLVAKYIPAFTLQDILDLLPKSIEYYGQLQMHFCEMPEGMYANQVVYSTIKGNQIDFFCKDVIDSAYEMLCWCVKNGYVETNKEG